MRTNGFLAGWVLAAGLMLSGCQSVIQAGLPDPKLTERDKQMMALAEPDEFRIPDVRNKIQYRTDQPPGTIVVDTGSNYLYYVLPHGQAIQYRIASGAEYMGWTGHATVGAMKEWPTWMPTASIMERWPEFRVLSVARAASGPVGQSARRPSALPLPGQPRYAHSYPRHQRAVGDRPARVFRLHTHA